MAVAGSGESLSTGCAHDACILPRFIIKLDAPPDLSSLLNQATQLANDALNQAQTQLQQATQDVSGNKDVQDALKATQGLINETRTAVNNGSIWNGAFNGSAIGNISSWAPNLEAYQQCVMTVSLLKYC